MNRPHKHAELIKAWADGHEIEIRRNEHWDWVHTDKPDWSEAYEYRIKPSDVARFYNIGRTHGVYRHDDEDNWDLKLIFDGETGELKSAEVLK